MTVNWIKFPTFDWNGAFNEHWKIAMDVFENVTHVKMEAKGAWKFLAGMDIESGPDGILEFPLADSALLLPGAPVGCLIGRLGGNSAFAPPVAAGSTESTTGVFAIGSHCLISLPQGVRGPLFVGFNFIKRPVEVTELKLELSGTTL